MGQRERDLKGQLPNGVLEFKRDENLHDGRAGYHTWPIINFDVLEALPPEERDAAYEKINRATAENLADATSPDVLLEDLRKLKARAQEELKAAGLPVKDGVWTRDECGWRPGSSVRPLKDPRLDTEQSEEAPAQRPQSLQKLAEAEGGRAAAPYRAFQLLQAADNALRRLPAFLEVIKKRHIKPTELVDAINTMRAVDMASGRLHFVVDWALAVRSHRDSVSGAGEGGRRKVRCTPDLLDKAELDYRAVRSTGSKISLHAWAKSLGADAEHQYGVKWKTLYEKLRKRPQQRS